MKKRDKASSFFNKNENSKIVKSKLFWILLIAVLLLGVGIIYYYNSNKETVLDSGNFLSFNWLFKSRTSTSVANPGICGNLCTSNSCGKGLICDKKLKICVNSMFCSGCSGNSKNSSFVCSNITDMRVNHDCNCKIKENKQKTFADDSFQPAFENAGMNYNNFTYTITEPEGWWSE